MSRITVMVGIGLLAAELAQGGGAPLVGRDNFNDNTINTALWKQAGWRTARFKERFGALYYDTWGGAEARSVAWYWKTTYTPFPGDKLQVSAVVTKPKISSPLAGMKASMGIGFSQGATFAARHFDVRVEQDGADFRISAYIFGSALSESIVWTPPVLDDSRFYLIASYEPDTGLVSIYQQSLDRSRKEFVTALNLKTYWSVPDGESLAMRPYVIAASEGVSFSFADGLFADNFSVKMTIP